jgi:HSP20 family protein
MKRNPLTRTLLSAGLLALVGGVGAASYLEHSQAATPASPSPAGPTLGQYPQDWSSDPWMRMYQDMQQIQARMDRMLEDSFQRLQAAPQPATMSSGARVSVAEQKDEYVVTAHIPGAKENNIRVSLDGRLLSISSQIQREDRKTAANGQTLSDQTYASSYQEAFTLPGPVSATGMHTDYKDGVLRVIVPKASS